ncbi:cocaine- and amphetamine-regulated transcript-like [Paralichthys olivaceus]|uniref:cocaine- and amphetamine-regulated transcript-like n=1 Tax=Paralichthys olivaceus TaxID=8255 RepID=UPI00097D3B9C|nr:PREDICTED: cocaine- and amphetamine-regulated transcript protein-like [Paralichthys olivaceus]
MSLGVFLQSTGLRLRKRSTQPLRPLLEAQGRTRHTREMSEDTVTSSLRPESSSSSSSSMDRSGMLRWPLLFFFLSLMCTVCHGQASQEVSAEDFGLEKPEAAADRDLVEALEALLGRMHSHISSTEKRGSIPLCGMGDRCAMKFGPRIGKLCDCGRGANCNSYLLKCI